jgi:hypothetical protein
VSEIQEQLSWGVYPVSHEIAVNVGSSWGIRRLDWVWKICFQDLLKWWVWWHRPVILELRKLSRRVVNSRVAWAAEWDCLKKKTRWLHRWLPIWCCWQNASVPCHLDVYIGLLKSPHNTVAHFPQSKSSKWVRQEPYYLLQPSLGSHPSITPAISYGTRILL